MQNIPARNKEIRSVFRAGKQQEIEKIFDDCLSLRSFDEVETLEGWKKAKDLVIGDTLILENGTLNVIKVKNLGGFIQIFMENNNE